MINISGSLNASLCSQQSLIPSCQDERSVLQAWLFKSFTLHLFIYYVGHTCTHYRTEDNSQQSSLSLCGFWDSNAGHRVWQPVPFPDEHISPALVLIFLLSLLQFIIPMASVTFLHVSSGGFCHVHSQNLSQCSASDCWLTHLLFWDI